MMKQVTQKLPQKIGKNTIPTSDKLLLPLSITFTFQTPTKEKESGGTKINVIGNTTTAFQYPLIL